MPRGCSTLGDDRCCAVMLPGGRAGRATRGLGTCSALQRLKDLSWLLALRCICINGIKKVTRKHVSKTRTRGRRFRNEDFTTTPSLSSYRSCDPIVTNELFAALLILFYFFENTSKHKTPAQKIQKQNKTKQHKTKHKTQNSVFDKLRLLHSERFFGAGIGGNREPRKRSKHSIE